MDELEQAQLLSQWCSDAEYRIAQGDTMGALRTLNAAADTFSDLCADLAQLAYNQGETKAAIARALRVPARTFRGMVRT